jgi:hypothetical protein
VDDNVFFGGDFTAANGVAASRIASWNGTTFTALGTGLNNRVGAIVVKQDGTLYAGGRFTTAGGSSANYVASWDGSTWSALGTGMNNYVHALALDTAGNLFAGGEFTTAGGNTANRIAKWNGAEWTAIGSGVSDVCRAIEILDNGDVYFGGDFSAEGYLVRLRDDVLSEIDTEVGGDIYALTSYNNVLYAGKALRSVDVYAGTTTIAYAGSEAAYPVLTIKRVGGTLAQIERLTNTLTGATVDFDYSLLNGETLTIDFRPGVRSCTSSVYGDRWDAVLDGSNISNFFLQSGNGTSTKDNIIALHVIETGSPTITANLTYRTAYRSLD